MFQCSVYKDNKKIGSFSEDSWGGPAMLSCPKQKDREALVDFAKKFEGQDAWAESYQTLIAKIVSEIDLIKNYKRISKTNLIKRVVKPLPSGRGYKAQAVKNSGYGS